jgi:hypothetical protein
MYAHEGVGPSKAVGRASQGPLAGYPSHGARSDRTGARRSIALAVIGHIGGRKRNGHACRRTASHGDGHKKDEKILHH